VFLTGATIMRRLFNRVLGLQSATRELFVHEDDWGQIEIVPAACRAWCEQEIARIEAFAAAHAAPDGAGWTDMYIRQSAPVALESLRISPEAAAQALGARLPAFDVVRSGTFSSPEPVAHVRGFGPAANTGVVLCGDATRTYVARIILVLYGSREHQRDVVAALADLPASSQSVLVDWMHGHVVPLDNGNAIARYLDA
jgi:hypothetical protein